jgi:hypothetical protein
MDQELGWILKTLIHDIFFSSPPPPLFFVLLGGFCSSLVFQIMLQSKLFWFHSFGEELESA